jgi:hypothetical protein
MLSFLQHQLITSLWNNKYYYLCGKWFDNIKAFYSYDAKYNISASLKSVDLNLQKILSNYRELDERDILRGKRK